MIITRNLVKSYLEYAGFRGTALNNAVDIAFCESSFNTTAHNTSGEDSRGLMQINVDAHPQYAYLDLFNPAVNTAIAYEIYKAAGYSFQPWTCARLLGIIKKPGANPGEIPFNTFLIAGLAFVGALYLYYK